MKLKHIIPFFIAALAIAVVSCSEDDEKARLDGLSVSQSIVGLDTLGTPVQVTVSANADWTFEKLFTQIVTKGDGSKDTIKAEVPEWLSVDKVSGGAGQTVISFSGTKATESHEAELKITSAGMTQYIKVIQTVEGGEPVILTVKEAIAMVQADQLIEKSIVVKGVVCRIDEISPQYGNATYYLSDDGSYTGKYSSDGSGDANWIEVYRGRWIDNAKFTTGDEFSVGDELVVSGIIVSYKGIPEFKQGASQVTEHNKSLIKVDSLSIANGELPYEGGDITAFLSNKGNGIMVEIPADAQEWLSIMGITPNSVKFHVAANTGAARKASIIIKTTDGGKDYSCAATISQKAFALPHGTTADDPFTVAEAIEKCKEIGATSDGVIYFAKGKIAAIEDVSTSFGNASFLISDDGTTTNALKVFRSYYLNNEKFTSADQISVGDEVVITGKLVNYTKDDVVTPEFSGNVYIYSQKAVGAPGTLENPFTPAKALEFVSALEVNQETADDYYIKGKIIEITDKNQFNTNFGNCTFYISDDGTDKEEKFQIFRTLYLGNVKYSDDNKVKPKAGDEVVICGKLVLYQKNAESDKVPETQANKSYIYSLNGATE